MCQNIKAMLEGFTRINKDNEAMFNQLANQKPVFRMMTFHHTKRVESSNFRRKDIALQGLKVQIVLVLLLCLLMSKAMSKNFGFLPC